MYGGNHFIFELSSGGFVDPWRDIVGPPGAEAYVESWARLFAGRSGGLWPLSERAVRHVRDLTFIVTLQHSEKMWAKEELTN